MEGRGFGNVPLTLDIKLSVEDAPNSGGVMIDAIRCMKLALDRGIGGVLNSIGFYHEVPAGSIHGYRSKWWKNSLMVGESGNGAVLLAAGEGRRLRPLFDRPKPLVHLLGLALIERNILAQGMRYKGFPGYYRLLFRRSQGLFGQRRKYGVSINYCIIRAGKRKRAVGIYFPQGLSPR